MFFKKDTDFNVRKYKEEIYRYNYGPFWKFHKLKVAEIESIKKQNELLEKLIQKLTEKNS